jgi:hypothetical protein
MESNTQTKRKAPVIECPACGEKAHSFRIRRVQDLFTVVGEFYHSTATCSGSMTLDMSADWLSDRTEEAFQIDTVSIGQR